MCLGVPGQIIEIINIDSAIGLVDVNGVKREVNLACVVDKEQPADSLIGQWVLIHVGFAMSLIDEQLARDTIAMLSELDELRLE